MQQGGPPLGLPAEKPQPRRQNLSGLAHVPATSYLARLVGGPTERRDPHLAMASRAHKRPGSRRDHQGVDGSLADGKDLGPACDPQVAGAPNARPAGETLVRRPVGGQKGGMGMGAGRGGDIYTTSRGRTTHKVTGPRGKYLSRPTILPPSQPPGCRFPEDTGCVPSETRPSPPHPPGPQSLSTSPQHMISETASAAAAMKKPLSASLGPAPPRPPPAPPPALLTPAWLRLRCERGLGRWS